MADDETTERKPMSRGAQTAWIVGAILLVAIGALVYQETRVPEDSIAAQCQRWYGIDSGCFANLYYEPTEPKEPEVQYDPRNDPLANAAQGVDHEAPAK